jgi:tRNA-2-methylthio-N6-dimethylallyladenosine synthase
MDERLQRLQSLLNEQQHDFNRTALGRQTDILLERNGKLDGQLVGKTPWLQSVHIIAPELAIGDMVDVTIESAGPNSLQGKVTRREAA